MKIVLISTYELGRQPFGLASPAAWLRARGHEVVGLDLSREALDEKGIRAAELIAFYVPMHTATRLAVALMASVRGMNSRAHICFYGLYAPVNEEYLRGLGVEDSGVHALIQRVYHLLGLRTFLTTGEKETRAWTIHAGEKAPTAAGAIHSDFERGFIAAETIQYDDLVARGSFAKAREAGKLRIEGKDYVVRDGDVILFRFNV